MKAYFKLRLWSDDYQTYISIQISPANNLILKPKKNHQALYLIIKLKHQANQKWNEKRSKGFGKQK